MSGGEVLVLLRLRDLPTAEAPYYRVHPRSRGTSATTAGAAAHSSLLFERTKPPTLRDVISSLPPLEAVKGKNEALWFHPLHRVGVMTPDKYWWVSHTPRGRLQSTISVRI
jgi:hypothetical protein